MIGERILNYQIESLIGEGGVGRVYLATHAQLGRKVAVKALNPTLVNHTEVRERFRNEAATLSSLQHINIITLYDYLEDDKGLFLIMEYANGSALDDYIRRTSGPIPEQKAIYFFNQILDGLQYAHQRGIVHRDIKPSNILVTGDADVKILDFGIAKILKEGQMGMTKTGSRLGTVLYMSPEQVKGQAVDHRTDIYSLGVTLYEMLTGRCPYDENRNSEYEIYEKILHEPLPNAKLLYPAISDKMIAIIDKATAKDPARRFQSCDEFRQALNSATNINFVNPNLVNTQIESTYSNQNTNNFQPDYTTQTSPNQNTKQTPKLTAKEQRERTNANILYIVLGGLLVLTLSFVYIEWDYLMGNTKDDKDVIANQDSIPDTKLNDDIKDDEPQDEPEKEKTPEEIAIDTLEDKKKKIEEFKKLLEKDRRAELLKGLLVDNQFESKDLGDYLIQVTVANKREDADFKDIIIGINYYDANDKEIKALEKELEPLRAGKSVTFKVRESVDAEKHKTFLKSADVVDLDMPPSLDSLNKEIKKVEELIQEIKDKRREKEEEE